MKNLIFILSMFLISNCTGNNENVKKDVKLKTKKEINHNRTEISIETQIQYSLKVSVYDNSELEIYFDGYKLTNDNAIGGLLDLNKFLLKNGKYKIKIKFKRENDILIDNEFLGSRFCKIEFVTLWENAVEQKNNPIVKLLSFNELIKPVSVFEQEWEVEINELPYELEGWQHSKSFKVEDSLLLKSQVIAYYEKIWQALNDGNTKEWELQNKQGWEEKKEYEYFSNDKHNEYESNRIKSLLEAKGKMHALEDYKLFVSEDGKLIHLERGGNKPLPANYKTSKKANDFPVLFSDDMTYDIRLYSPRLKNGSFGDFKFIR